MKRFNELVKEIQSYDYHKKHQTPSGLTSGFEGLDSLTGGFQKGELSILASRPSMGKTTLAINFGLNAVQDGNAKVLIFSLDEKAESLVTKLTKNLAEKGIISEDLAIFFEDEPCISIFELMKKAAIIKHAENIDFIIVDSLDYITSGDSNHSSRWRSQLNDILHVQLLKTLALSLNIPILLLTSLSRKLEQRGGNKRPILLDLVDRDNTAQYADVVLVLYRSEYYGITIDEEGDSLENQAELIVLKNNNGRDGVVMLNSDFERARFWEG